MAAEPVYVGSSFDSRTGKVSGTMVVSGRSGRLCPCFDVLLRGVCFFAGKRCLQVVFGMFSLAILDAHPCFSLFIRRIRKSNLASLVKPRP